METNQETKEAPPQTEAEKRIARAKETLQNYGIAVIGLGWWNYLCIRDGWFVPDYKWEGFSRFMAYVTTPALIFCIVMLVRAYRTLKREKKQQPPTSPPAA